MTARIFMSAGEPSGVGIGATLMRTLKQRIGDDVRFAGLGGPAMVDEGLRMIFDPAQTAAMWLWGNLKRIPAHRRALDECIADWKRERPDVVVTIDYQAFHLYVGTRARALGIPVVHFVGSQFWARRYYTLEPIRRAYSHVLVIHEFEKRYYDEAGIPATFVGHPLFERLEKRELDHALIERLRSGDGLHLGLLPGSRGLEIRAALPVMLDAVRRLTPKPRVSVSVAHPQTRPFVEESLAASGLDHEILDYSSGEILSSADLGLITSGSASMEAVYYGRPSVIVYRLSPVSYFLAKPQVITYFGQPNLIADRRIVPEILQWRRSGRRLAEATQRLIDHEDERDRQRAEFDAIKTRLLGGPMASEAAAEVVLDIIRTGNR